MPALPPGSPAPDFSLSDAEGGLHTLSEAISRGAVVLTFFKISCPTSQYALPFLNRLWKKLAGHSVTVWAISQDSVDHTRLFNREFKIDLPQLFDAQDAGYPTSEAYGITNVPTTFAVDTKGGIAQTSVGWSRQDLEQVALWIATQLGIQAPVIFEPDEAVVEFRPGCASKN
jgi:peroxiredoxin Q/BCP